MCGTELRGQPDDGTPQICNWSTTMLLMGLANNGFSPNNIHDGDEAAWQGALQPPRLYDIVAAEAHRDPQRRPVWDALQQEVRDLLFWASTARDVQGADRLLYQTVDGQWHWNGNAAHNYDVMHAWAVDGGWMARDDWIVQARSDGGTATNTENGGEGVSQDHPLIGNLRGALFEAAELCDRNQERGLIRALSAVHDARLRVRQHLWNWDRRV